MPSQTWKSPLVVLLLMGLSALPASASSSASQAAAIAAQLNPANLTSLTDYTRQRDPEHLLGLPGQYTAKAAFTDTNGVVGIVEVFASPDDLSSRLASLGTVASDPTQQEYDVTAPGSRSKVLLRLFVSSADPASSFYTSALNAAVTSSGLN